MTRHDLSAPPPSWTRYRSYWRPNTPCLLSLYIVWSPDHTMARAWQEGHDMLRPATRSLFTRNHDASTLLFIPVMSHKLLKLFHCWLTRAGAANSATPFGGRVYASECKDPHLTAKYRCRRHGFIPLRCLEGYFRINASQLRTDHRYMSSSAHHPIQP